MANFFKYNPKKKVFNITVVAKHFNVNDFDFVICSPVTCD